MTVAAVRGQINDRISALKSLETFPLLQNVQTASRSPPAPAPYSLLYNGYHVYFTGVKRPECEVTTDSYLVAKLRMSRSIPLLPHMPSRLGKGKLYLYIYIYIYIYTS